MVDDAIVQVDEIGCLKNCSRVISGDGESLSAIGAPLERPSDEVSFSLARESEFDIWTELRDRF